MERLKREAVNDLLAIDSPEPAVTIYAPMHVAADPPHMTEDQIRLKNLIHQAAEKLKAHEDGEAMAKKLCERLWKAMEDRKFWEHLSPGLLICARGEAMKFFALPIDTEECVAVDRHFYLAPVLGMLHDAREYYVLTVVQHDPCLFRGDMYSLEDAGIELPKTVRGSLNIDEAVGRTEHSLSASGSNVNTSGYNGRGGARDPRPDDRQRFFRLVDKTVMDHADRSLPLVLAGIDAELAEYRSLTRYPHVLKGDIHGSFGGAKPHELFAPARQIIEQELVAPARQAAVEEYERLAGANPDRVASDRAAITEAVEQGRVDKLLTRLIRQTTDTVRDTAASVARITFPEPALNRHLNALAQKVWQMSGTVITLEEENMPGGAPMVARLRY